MTDSPILGIPQVSPNQNNKETTINDGFSIVERSLNQLVALDASAGNVTLTTQDFQHNILFKVSGHSVARDLVVPNKVRFFGIQNIGTGTVTVKTASPSSTISVPAASWVLAYCDGANGIVKIADSAAAASTPDFTGLTDVPASYTGHAGKSVRVNLAEDGLEFDMLTLSDMDDVDTYVNNFYLRVKSDGSGIEFVAANPGGETDFIMLNDVPNDYTGQAGKLVRVNAVPDGLEFTSVNDLIAFIQLADSPASYSGQAGKLVAVNLAANALEFIPYPTSGEYVDRTVDVLNSGFEAGTLDNWTITSGDTDINAASLTYTTVGAVDLDPDAGTYMYRVADDTSTEETLVQSIATGGWASNTEVDNSATIEVTARFTAGNADSRGQLIVKCLNASLAVIGTTSSSVTATTPGTYQTLSVNVSIPTGTRWTEITLKTTTLGALLEGAWDEVNGIATVILYNTFLTLPDTPDDFATHGNKFVKVNSGATALEFATLSIKDATDVPDSYTGQANRVLAVKGDESGMEFVDLPAVYTDEMARDALGAAIVAGANITVTVNDAGDTITIASTASGTVAEAPSDGTPYARQDAGWVTIVRRIQFTLFAVGLLTNDELLFKHVCATSCILPTSLTGSRGVAVATTGAVTLAIKKNGASIGTVNFAAAATTATFTFASPVSFVAGDIITINAPVTADATLADVSINLLASEN